MSGLSAPTASISRSESSRSFDDELRQVGGLGAQGAAAVAGGEQVDEGAAVRRDLVRVVDMGDRAFPSGRRRSGYGAGDAPLRDDPERLAASSTSSRRWSPSESPVDLHGERVGRPRRGRARRRACSRCRGRARGGPSRTPATRSVGRCRRLSLRIDEDVQARLERGLGRHPQAVPLVEGVRVGPPDHHRERGHGLRRRRSGRSGRGACPRSPPSSSRATARKAARSYCDWVAGNVFVEPEHRRRVDPRPAVHREVAAVGAPRLQLEGLVVERLRDQHRRCTRRGRSAGPARGPARSWRRPGGRRAPRRCRRAR